jgi:aspartyl-tRNA(Asn)/glutamyl-tRNA(Gln) amidotransferase subunit C
MSFDSTTLARLSKLARIDLPDAELARLGTEMSSISDLIDQLQAVDTKGVLPLSHPLAVIEEIAQPLRADAVTETNQREANLANAPETENGLFLVPKVIE